MSHRYYVIILFLVFGILLPACNTYFYSGKGNDISAKNNKCIKKCSKATNDLLRIKCYTKCIEKNPTNPDLYFIRGEQYRNILKFTPAISDFIKSVELEPGNLEAYYAVASTASLAYKKEYALHWLQKALEAGFNDYQRISTDPYLDNIRNTKEFKILIKKFD